jgi:hypothetical protein
LVHRCSSRSCMKRVGVGSDEVKCRVTNNAFESPNFLQHSIKCIHVQHSKSAEEILEDIGLFTRNVNTLELEPAHECLKAIKHYPPLDPICSFGN